MIKTSLKTLLKAEYIYARVPVYIYPLDRKIDERGENLKTRPDGARVCGVFFFMSKHSLYIF